MLSCLKFLEIKNKEFFNLKLKINTITTIVKCLNQHISSIVLF